MGSDRAGLFGGGDGQNDTDKYDTSGDDTDLAGDFEDNDSDSA